MTDPRIQQCYEQGELGERFQACLFGFVDRVIDEPDRAGPARTDHRLHVCAFDTFIDEAVRNTGRARDAIPWPQTLRGAPAVLVFEKEGDDALQNEKCFLDLMSVRGAALAG